MRYIVFCSAIIGILILPGSPHSYAQSDGNKVFDLGFEFQAYPTGLIPGLRFEKGFSARHAIHLRLGYNYINHGEAGKHEDEKGAGIGFTLGYKYYISEHFSKAFAGIRNDIWFSQIDWKDDIGKPTEKSGTTDIVVVQPTLEFGWAFTISPSLVLAPTLGIGYEVNVKTDGSPTGEGAILLAGLNVLYRFKR